MQQAVCIVQLPAYISPDCQPLGKTVTLKASWTAARYLERVSSTTQETTMKRSEFEMPDKTLPRSIQMPRSALR